MKQEAQPKLTRLSIHTVQKLCVVLETFLISSSYIYPYVFFIPLCSTSPAPA